MVPLPLSSYNSSAVSTMNAMPESARLIAFLKEYRVLECTCCDTLFGFQHKTTGALYCVGGCHERSPPTPATSTRANFLTSSVPSILMATPFSSLNSEQGTAATSVEKKPVAAAVPVNNVEKQKPIVAPVRDVDTTDCAPPRKQEVSKPVTVPVKMVEPPKQEARPVAKPATPTRHLWSSLKYSENLLTPNAQVRVQFSWSPVLYTVVADADEAALIKMQEAVKACATSSKTLKQLPVLDEIVIASYDDDFFRARVVKVEGDTCELVFIDYGDKKVAKYTEVFPISSDLMKCPVYGMNVHLRLPNITVDPALKLDETLEEYVYTEPFVIDMNKKGPAPVPGAAESYEVRMWDVERENTLNEKVTNLIGDWRPLTLEEQMEVAYFMTKNPYLREIKETLEDVIREDLEKWNEPNNYVFNLDQTHTNFQYKIQDMLCFNPSFTRDDMEVEITKFESLAEITAKPVGEPFDTIRNRIGDNLNQWIESRSSTQMLMLQKDFVPQFEGMCIVQWPYWEEVYYAMELIQDKWLHEFLVEGNLDIFKRDYDNYSGKWFRAACVSDTESLLRVKTNDGDQRNDTAVYKMFLVDLGKTTLVPTKNVYRMPHRFMIDFQASMFLSLVMDDLIQYDDNEDEKWKYLLLPGLKIKIKVLWMIDEICIAKLIAPSEKEFREHFEKPNVQEEIKRKQMKVMNHQRHRKVRQMSKMKGTFDKNWKIVLAQEAEEANLKPLLDKYSDIGRIHPDRILELC